MDKKVDGIKKIDSKNVSKYRKVVLDSIMKETERIEAEQGLKEQRSKKIDGIHFSKSLKLRDKGNTYPDEKKLAPNFKEDEEAIEGEKEVDSEGKIKEEKEALAKRLREERMRREKEENERRKTEEKKANELRLKNKKEEEVRIQKEKEAAKKIEEEKVEKQKKEQEKLRIKKEIELKKIQEEKMRKAEAEKNKKEKELRKQEEIEKKKQEKIFKEKARKENERNKLLQKKKRAQERAAKIEKIKGNFKNLKVFLAGKFKLYFKKCFVIFSLAVLITLLLYFLLIVFIINFKIDSPFTRYISKYFPIPALITEGNIVEYYEYQDQKKSLSDQYESEDSLNMAVKILIMKKIIINNLANKYNVGTIDELKDNFIYDKSANQVAINRISKIREMIKTKDDFVRVAVKYGDDQGKLDYNSSDEAVSKFGEKVKDLEIGAISDVLVGEDGYYIVRRYEKDGSDFSISYVFVKAKTLDEYLSETISSSKVWSFVD